MGFRPDKADVVANVIKNLITDIEENFTLKYSCSPFTITITFDHYNGKYGICGFTLTEQPNCCGALISTKTWVHMNHRGQGYAKNMMALKEAIAKEFGYSVLTATVNISGNPAEVHILEKSGWSKGYEFLNQRTGNIVGFFFKTLPIIGKTLK